MRQKGTPNRKTDELMAIAKRLKVSPFEVLCLFAGGRNAELGYAQLDPGVRMKAAAEAAKYLYPQRRAVEVSAPEPFRVVVEDYSRKDA